MEKCGLDAKETIVPNVPACAAEREYAEPVHTDKDGITVRIANVVGIKSRSE
ncbi:MAG: hypothetical protein ACLTK0_11830 [Anaerovoracaceae bacterium]